MRFAHLIETNGPGGAERMLVHMVRELQAGGHNNIVVAPAGGEQWLQQELASLGVVVEAFRLDQPVSQKFAAWLSDVLQRHRIDLAHSPEFTMAVYGAWASRRVGIPFVATMHGSRYYVERWRRRIALRLAFAMTGKVVAVSRALAHALRHDLWLPKSRVTTIGNGVRPEPTSADEASSNLRDELGLAPDDQLAVSVGNLYPVKGHRFAVEALTAAPRLHLAIAGRGDLATALEKQAAALGVADRLHLLGLRSDIGALLAQADLFVLPSLSEGLPLALLEAMFAGCAIVASDVGDVRTALDDGRAGVLVPAGDATALGRTIADLIADPTRRAELAARARQRALEEYDVSRMVTRYLAIYRELLGRSGTPAAEQLTVHPYGTPT
jgi:glycosyltransferase involved in cell wall biosynthesis